MSRLLGVALVLCVASAPAFAERPKTVVQWIDPTPAALTPAGTAPYNTIFLNKCANGCVIHPGQPNSKTDSWGINGTRTLTAWPYDDATWQAVMNCMKDTFSPFNVQITDQDPGQANHFEIMIAGSPTDLGMSAGVGGISPFNCSTYIDNSLVFDFAKVWNGSVEDICSTAAQEIAHSFALDHTIVASDPLTYYNYPKRRYFQNGLEVCGSDCVNGQAPNGATCTGTNSQQHACACTGGMQDPTATMTALFGKGTPVLPDVAITKPESGANVMPGFAVVATAMDISGIDHVELRVDGTLVTSLTSSPYAFNAPSTLGAGNHHVEISAINNHMVANKTAIDVYIGAPCTKPSDCPEQTQTCIGGRCVAGPGVQGGLGSTCMSGPDCASGQCASDGTNHYCVENCDLGQGQCPPGFGCLDPGNGMGVCWKGYDDGSGGGGGCATGSGGPIVLGLVFAGLVLTRRRR